MGFSDSNKTRLEGKLVVITGERNTDFNLTLSRLFFRLFFIQAPTRASGRRPRLSWAAAARA